MGEVISLDGYRQNGPSEFERQRQEHIRRRVGELATQIALLESEKQRLERVLDEA